MDKPIITEQQVKDATPERFWSKIKFDEPNKCWEWALDTLHGDGYGRYYDPNILKNVRASRFIAKYLIPEFKNNLCVLHNCPNGDNRACVNPNHLWIGTRDDNNKDMVKKGVMARGSKNGHAKLTEENVLEIRRRISLGEVQSLIAKDFGVGTGQISAINTGKEWSHVVCDFKRSNRRHNEVLSHDDVREIRRRLSLKEKQTSIAKSFGVGDATISAIKHGQQWSRVT